LKSGLCVNFNYLGTKILILTTKPTSAIRKVIFVLICASTFCAEADRQSTIEDLKGYFLC